MAITDNCVLYRKLDETSGTSAADSSWTWNTGTTANITRATGKINNGGTFDGTSTVISTWSVLSWTGNFTIAMRIKTTSNTKALANKRNSNTNWIFFWLIASDWKQQYLDYNGSTFTTNVLSTNSINDWNFNLVWISRNWTTIKFWKNWSQDWGWTSSSTLSFNTNTFRVGNDVVDTNRWFNWQIDEVWVRTKELTTDERTTLYNGWTWVQYPFVSAVNTTDFFQVF